MKFTVEKISQQNKKILNILNLIMTLEFNVFQLGSIEKRITCFREKKLQASFFANA